MDFAGVVKKVAPSSAYIARPRYPAAYNQTVGPRSALLSCLAVGVAAILYGCSSASHAPSATSSDAAITPDAGGSSKRDGGHGPSHDSGGVDAHHTVVTDSGSTHDVGAPLDASAPACGVPFSASGPWCYKLPASTPMASNSAAVVANIQSDIQNNYGTFSINTDTFSAPLYTVEAGAPTSNWTFDDCQNKGSLPASFAPALMNVPTLPGMVSSMGTDHEISLYDPTEDKDWEFWVATQADASGQWSACWGGVITNVSTNLGQFPAGLGATASGLPLLAYVIRIAELQSGLIQHAINIETVRTQATNYSWPANRTDGNTADADILMEGQRMRLDPTFDVTTLPHPAERTIAKAMQDYGIILTDTSGAVVVQAEDDRPYMTAHDTTTSPYTAIFDGTPAYSVLADIPLSRLQVLPQNYGQSFLH
jgi:hypothetical protein